VQLVPYDFNSQQLPEMEPNGLGHDGLAGMGVWFTFESKHLNFLLEKVRAWYEGRDEVVLVDFGITDKRELGCIVMEWEGYACDQLFVDILRTEPMIEDYCVYEVQA
jgi:hypothetical protein